MDWILSSLYVGELIPTYSVASRQEESVCDYALLLFSPSLPSNCSDSRSRKGRVSLHLPALKTHPFLIVHSSPTDCVRSTSVPVVAGKQYITPFRRESQYKSLKLKTHTKHEQHLQGLSVLVRSARIKLNAGHFLSFSYLSNRLLVGTEMTGS